MNMKRCSKHIHYSKVNVALNVEIVKDQGLFALWRGNIPNCYKLIIQNMSLVYIDKYMTSRTTNLSLLSTFATSVLSSFFTTLLAYPFEMVSTRMCSDMTRHGHKRIYSNTFETLMRIGYLDEGNSTSSRGSLPILN